MTPRFLIALTLAVSLAGQTGIPHTTPQVRFENSPRVHELMRAGNLYLSVQDALALAIENNLDIELQRYALPQGDTELLRAKGGGLTAGRLHRFAVERFRVSVFVTYTCRPAVRWPRG